MKNSDSFFERVYKVAREIPQGRVTSYGAIAKFLGSAKSARVVGWAMNDCQNAQFYVPAHRVVNRNGLLTGKRHFGNSDTMKQLLENEGIQFEGDQIQNLKECFWDPMLELDVEEYV